MLVASPGFARLCSGRPVSDYQRDRIFTMD
jgi:hypothetical protein